MSNYHIGSYRVMRVDEYEYGCREPIHEFNTREEAQAWIDEKGRPTVILASGDVEPLYTIQQVEFE